MADFYSGFATPPNGGAKYRIHLVVTVAAQNVVANTSDLLYQLILEKDRSWNGFYEYSATNWSVTINGTALSVGSGANPLYAWTGWSTHTVASGSITVSHATDGTKAGMTVAAVYNGANSGWAIGTVSISSTMDLPTIPRATTPTVAPSPAVVGSDVTIDLPRVVGTYTHDVTWRSGTLSGSIGTGLGASTTWTVPDVMAEFPDRDTAPISISVVTKSGATAIGTKLVTLFAVDAPVAPTLWTLDTKTQFDIRARLVTYEGGTWEARHQLLASTIQLVDPSSATATCSLEISNLLAADFEDYSVVDIDIYDGENWIFTNRRFVLSRSEGDDADPTLMKRYSGTEFIDYSLGLAYAQKDYDWTDVTPGEILATLLVDAQAREWGPRIDYEFNATDTSFGADWQNTVKRSVTKGTPLSQVLAGLVDDGLVEYRTSYHTDKAWLVLLNPGTGSNFATAGASPVVNVGLAKIDRAPHRASVEKRLTRVTVAGDNDIQITRQRSSFDGDVFGQTEGWVSASGVTKDADARQIGDNALRDNQSPVSERTFEYSAKNVSPELYPYHTFRPGDWVLTPDGDNVAQERIGQITVDKSDDGSISLTLLTGDRILSGVASLSKRQSAQTGGSIPGGTQVGPAPLDSRIPSAPVLDTITSAGYWNTDGAAKSTVTISWAQVTEALNGASINCDLYEIWERPTSGGVAWSFRYSTNSLTADLPGWDVLADLEFRVRARSSAGVFGQFSDNQTHTTLAPAVDLDGPDIADLYTDGVGSIYIVWGGLLNGVAAPARVAYVGAEISTDDITFVPSGTPIVAAGQIILNPNAWGDFYIRLRAYDRLGNPGTASASEAISLVDPHIDPPTPLAPVGLDSTAGAGWNPDGITLDAYFDLTWTAVTLDVDSNAVAIAGYEIWGKRSTETIDSYITSSATNGVRIAVQQGETWGFQVRAVSEYGALSAFGATVIDTADATLSAPAAPDAPTLNQYAGLLRVKWSGNGMVPQVKYAYASISSTLGGTYVRSGMPLIGAGEVVLANLAPGDYYAKINLVDEIGQVVSSAASAVLTLLPITGVTIQTSPIADTGIKMTDAALTVYNAAHVPTFILNAATGEVWIGAYDAVFNLGASGAKAESPFTAVNGIAISSQDSSFNTFIHPSGLQIRNDQTPLSWWEADATDASLVNFFSPRAYIKDRLRTGDFEALKETKAVGTRLVYRYKGDT